MSRTDRRALPSDRVADLIREANDRRHQAAQAARGSAPTESAAAADRSRRAKASGDTYERLMDAAVSWYLAQGLADLRQQHPEVAILSGVANGVFRGRFIGAAPIDYVGTLAGGRAVHIEVKGSATTNLPWEVAGEPRLRPEQARDLASAHRLGALAAVLVCVQAQRPRGRASAGPPGRTWYLLRWPAWEAAWAEAQTEGAKSLSHDLLRRHGVECPAPHGWPDWLAALEKEATQ